jgi:hypothetical protein
VSSGAAVLDPTGWSSELLGMTSSATWLPAAIARAAVVTALPAQAVPTGGRHAAPEMPRVVAIAAPEDLDRHGRHADAEFDPARDEVDVLTWLGFTAAD